MRKVEAENKLRGPIGSEVKITIARDNLKELIDLTIVRDTPAKIEAVHFALLEPDYGYLKLSSLEKGATSRIKSILDKFKKEDMLLKKALEVIKTSPSSQIQDISSNADKSLKNKNYKIKYVTDRIKFALRTGPSSDEKVLDVVQNGQELEIIERGEEWSRVQLINGKQGWILTRYIVQHPYALSGSPLKLSDRYYATDKLKLTLCDGPGIQHKILSILESRQRVKIIFAGNEWSRIIAPDGKEGWVLSRYLIDYPNDRWYPRIRLNNLDRSFMF